MASDLFGFEPAITWDEAGKEGRTRDGGKVSLDLGLTGRFVMILELKHGVITRRSCATVEDAVREIEKAAEAAR